MNASAQKAQSPAATGLSAEQKTFDHRILSAAPAAPEEKQFHTIAAAFALKGHALQRSTRADDGRVSYTVSRWNQSRVFTHWNDVTAFLKLIGGAA